MESRYCKYIFSYTTGQCIGKIESANLLNLQKILNRPFVFGFEPLNMARSIIWGRYKKSDIIFEIKTNLSNIFLNEILHIKGIVFIKKYYILINQNNMSLWNEQ
jgi:hypothetical protein